MYEANVYKKKYLEIRKGIIVKSFLLANAYY